MTTQSPRPSARSVRRGTSAAFVTLPILLALIPAVGASLPSARAAQATWTSTKTLTYGLEHAATNLYFGRIYGDYFTVKVVDDSGRDVGGHVSLRDGGGRTYGGWFCKSSGRIRVGAGEALTVSLDTLGDTWGAHSTTAIKGGLWPKGGPGCVDLEPPVPGAGGSTLGATSGRVIVTFIETS